MGTPHLHPGKVALLEALLAHSVPLSPLTLGNIEDFEAQLLTVSGG